MLAHPTGDFVYADHHLPNMYPGQDDNADNGYPNQLSGIPATTNQERWDLWGRFVQPLFSTAPHAGATGNHEIEQASVTKLA